MTAPSSCGKTFAITLLMPTFFATALAVFSLSPVNIIVSIPSLATGEDSFKVSAP